MIFAGLGLCKRVGLGAARLVSHAWMRRPKMTITLAIAGVAIAAGTALMSAAVGSNDPGLDESEFGRQDRLESLSAGLAAVSVGRNGELGVDPKVCGKPDGRSLVGSG